MATTNYIAVVKQLENGKFLISFPDFEGITTVAETEESIQNISLGIIKTKLGELKKANIEAPEPKKIVEISKNLKEGEFATYISVKNSFDFKTTMTSLKDKEAFKEGTKEVTNKVNNFVNNIPQGNERFFGIAGGALSIVNTLFLAILSFNIPFFGDFKIGFFKGLSGLADFSEDVKNVQSILIFSGVFFIALAALIIYSSLTNNKNILKYSIFGNIAFLIIFYVVLYVKLPGGEASSYISVSFFKILLYIISIVLAYVNYMLLNKVTDEENIEKNIQVLGTVLEKEEEKDE